jgi:hypothetical protein
MTNPPLASRQGPLQIFAGAGPARSPRNFNQALALQPNALGVPLKLLGVPVAHRRPNVYAARPAMDARPLRPS